MVTMMMIMIIKISSDDNDNNDNDIYDNDIYDNGYDNDDDNYDYDDDDNYNDDDNNIPNNSIYVLEKITFNVVLTDVENCYQIEGCVNTSN